MGGGRGGNSHAWGHCLIHDLNDLGFCVSFNSVTLSSLTLPLSSHPLQAANCCRNSRLVVDEDDLMWVKK